MGIRVQRHYTNRKVEADSSKVMAVIPIFKHEQLRHLRYEYEYVTSENEKLINVPDINTCALWVPYEVLTTSSDYPINNAGWDTLASRLLIEVGSDDNEYYASDPVSDPMSVKDASDGGLSEESDEPLISGTTPGPTGVMVFDRQETLMSPLIGFGDDEVRFSHRGVTVIDAPLSMGVLLPMVYRYEQTRPSGLGGEFYSSLFVPSGTGRITGDLDKATGQNTRLYSALWGGDLMRVQHAMTFGIGTPVEQLKSYMWGGDTTIESNIWEATDYTPVIGAIKAWCSIQTPYTIFK